MFTMFRKFGEKNRSCNRARCRYLHAQELGIYDTPPFFFFRYPGHSTPSNLLYFAVATKNANPETPIFFLVRCNLLTCAVNFVDMVVEADGIPQVGKPSDRIGTTAVHIGSCRSSMYCPRRPERLCWFTWIRMVRGPSFLLLFWHRKGFGTRFG
jgi:hypothetical protein